MSLAQGLTCSECEASYPLDGRTACDRCFAPLSVDYDLAPIAGERPFATLLRSRTGIWRYGRLLPPVTPAVAERLSVGGTPLRRATRLAEAWGLQELWLKDETVLPTGSFKDRPASVAVALASSLGYHGAGCASTGNLAAATARAAVRVGLPCWVFVPPGLPSAKLQWVQTFGGHIVEVEGTYDDANRVANLAGELGRIALANVTLRPYYTEGSKTLALETLEALGWESPDWIGVPLGSGALLAATQRAVQQVRSLGWLGARSGSGPAIFGSQPLGCAPIVEAFEKRRDTIVPVRAPQTIAESLAIGDPASGYEALRAIRESGGFADAPSHAEVRQAILDLARFEGIWTEPAGGTVLASLRRKLEQGAIHRSDRVVALLTGAGWKTPTVLGPSSNWSLHPVRLSPHDRELPVVLRRTLAAAGAGPVSAASGGKSPW